MLKGRLSFEMSEETAAVVKALRGVNQYITYIALSRAVGFTVTGATPALISARRHLESRENVVFDVVRGIGLSRLDDIGKVNSTAKHQRTLNRTSRRGQKRMGTIENFAALPKEKQLEATLRMTQFEFVQQAVSSKKLPDIPKVQRLNVADMVKG